MPKLLVVLLLVVLLAVVVLAVALDECVNLDDASM